MSQQQSSVSDQPRPGIARIAVQAIRDLWANDGVEWAAALSFYTLLSLFPLLIIVIVMLSYVADPRWATDQLVVALNGFFPSSQIDANALLDGAVRARGRLGIISLVAFIVTGRRVFGTLVAAMDRVSDVDERRETWHRRALAELALGTGFIALAFGTMASHPLVDLAGQSTGWLPGRTNLAVAIAINVLQTLLIFGTFTLVYAVVPKGHRIWRAVLIGAACATGLFLITQEIFTIIIRVLWDSLTIIYGPLAAAALLLTFVYWVALVTLTGASLASHIKVMWFGGASAREASASHVEQGGELDPNAA